MFTIAGRDGRTWRGFGPGTRGSGGDGKRSAS